MDPLGLLLEIVALAAYPGGLFLAVLAWMTHRGAALPRETAPDGRGLAAIAMAVVAAAMAPLPGTPAASLPPPGGATPNLAASILLIAAACSLVAPRPWSLRRRVLVAFGGAALVLLGLIATSFSSTDISGSPGGLENAARILTIAGVLIALPLVVQPHSPGGWTAARATVVVATLEVVLAVVIPPGMTWPAAPLWVLGLAVAVVAYSVVLRLVRSAARAEHPSLVALASLCFAAAAVASVIVGRA
jgi:hypothetical protein